MSTINLGFPSISGQYYKKTWDTETRKTSDKISNSINEVAQDIASTSKVKNTSSLPDKVFEDIQKMAKEDAQKNIYMSDRFGAYRKSTMQQYVSPNRSKLISILNPMITNARYTNGQYSSFKIPSFSGFSGRIAVGAMFGAYMSVFNNNGEEVLSYSPPPNGGWVSTTTSAEHKWLDDTRTVYYEAYQAARDEIKAQATSSSNTENATAVGFNVTV